VSEITWKGTFDKHFAAQKKISKLAKKEKENFCLVQDILQYKGVRGFESLR